METPKDEANELTSTVAFLVMGQPEVTVENFGTYNTKVSGRSAHIIREVVENDSRVRVRRDINQYAFTVEWDA